LKILDATTIIAIFNEIDYLELIDKIRRLGHDLAVLSHVMESELLDGTTLRGIKKYVDDKKIHVIKNNTIDEIKEFRKDFPGLGLGECDSMLSYQKLKESENSVYCILDDAKARHKAGELRIKFTGLIGLLGMMRDKSILTNGEVRVIVERLRDSDFRLPEGVVI